MKEQGSGKIRRARERRVDNHPTSELRRYLSSQGTDDHGTLVALLAAAWPSFDGGEEHAMRSFKLARIEEPSWEPPVLRFIIERHGGTVLGSKRSELQAWQVDLDARTAEAFGAGFRQLVPNAPHVDVKALAAEVALAVNDNPGDPRLKWFADGSVQPVLSRIVPGGPRQTFEGRCARLSKALPTVMAAAGWQPAPFRNRYVRATDAGK